MQDILSDIQTWLTQSQPFALARVTRTWGSSPREVGAAMAVRADLAVSGSVSGGCVENAVIETARQVLKDGRPQHLHFGVSDGTAWSLGLTCGGKISVLVDLHPACTEDALDRQIWDKLTETLAQQRPVVLLSKLVPGKNRHLLVDPEGAAWGDWGEAASVAIEVAQQFYRERRSGEVEIAGEALFLQVFPRPAHLLVIGASHIAIPLVKLAKEMQFAVTVIDPRQIFAAPERFPLPPDRLLNVWPEAALSQLDLNDDTYAVLLTHDPKIDDAALHILLQHNLPYIGALGSSKTHARRRQRLQEAGFSQAQIDRIHGPVGLDIGAKTPGEIALSIMAQVVQARRAPR